MRTVFDVMRENEGAAMVLVERHGSYLMGPLTARCPDGNVAAARNYAELEPSVMFLLDKAGIERSWQQGRQFAEAEVEITEILGSHQGRGPDTGLRISEGHFMAKGAWIPFRCHAAVDYPRYNYEPVLQCLREIGDPFVAQWLNGGHTDLVRSDTPGSFKGRVMGFIGDLLSSPGVRVITTHFEIATLVHGIAVEGRDLGTIREDWFPAKSGGILIVRKGEEQKAWDYTPDLTVVE